MYRLFALISVFLILIACKPLDITQESDTGFRFNRPRKKSITIPVNITHNLIIIPVSINNSPPFNFLLDTGVKTTILSEPLLLEFIRPDSIEDIIVLGLGKDGFILADKVKNITFAIDGITGPKMDMIVLPDGVVTLSEHLGFPVYGIIGYDLFKQFPVRVNYSSKTITIYQESNYRIPRRRTTMVPLEIINSKPYLKTVIESYDNRKDTVNLLLDLGASTPLLLNEEFYDFSEKHINSYLGKGLSGLIIGREGRLNSVKIEDIKISDPLVAYPGKDFLFPSESGITDWDGILGGGILKKFQLIIDYSEEVAYFRRGYKFFREYLYPNLSGIEIVAEGPKYNRFKVDYVREGSVADEVEIKEGDYIIAINDIPAIQLTLEEIVGRLNTRPGDLVFLKLQRDKMILIKRISLRSDV